MVSVAAVVTHRRPGETTAAVRELIEVARARRVTLRFTEDEAAKHGIELGPFIEIVPELADDIDLCIVLGGDGTILTALRRYAGTGVPVFAVNYGEVGFLATIDPERARGGLRARVRGRVRHDRAADDLGRAPGRHLERAERHLRAPQGGPARRRPRVRARGRGDRPRPLRRARDRDPAGLDGLQPRQRRAGAGVGRGGLRRLVHRSALADGTSTGRRAGRRTDDQQRSREEPVEVHVDGRPTLELPPGEDIHIAFGLSHGTLAQIPGASFYHRLRERFGRLAR